MKGLVNMLVLSRKIGEQVVLPSCGVTIAVVRIAGNKVRLGIQAPPETSVHRQELWDRISDDRAIHMERQPTESANGPPHADGPAVRPEDDLCSMLAHRIAQRTGGRIRSLQVDRVDDRIVVSGRTSTYHAQQLACAAADELLGRPGSRQDDVHFDIQVTPPAPQNRGG
jgi:carbon storage regulator